MIVNPQTLDELREAVGLPDDEITLKEILEKVKELKEERDKYRGLYIDRRDRWKCRHCGE